MKTLHRAFCSCNHWRYKDVDEQTVFFETFHTEDDWPLMLVSPRTHERLVKAFLRLEERSVEANHG